MIDTDNLPTNLIAAAEVMEAFGKRMLVLTKPHVSDGKQLDFQVSSYCYQQKRLVYMRIGPIDERGRLRISDTILHVSLNNWQKPAFRISDFPGEEDVKRVMLRPLADLMDTLARLGGEQ